MPPTVARLAVEMSGANRRPCGRSVELVEHHPRLDPGPALGDVQFEDAIEILRRVELQPGADGLARLRRAAAARRDRHTVPARGLHRPHDIVPGPGDDDAERHDLIDAGVSGVEGARDAVEPDFALDLFLELLLKGARRHRERIVPLLIG